MATTATLAPCVFTPCSINVGISPFYYRLFPIAFCL